MLLKEIMCLKQSGFVLPPFALIRVVLTHFFRGKKFTDYFLMNRMRKAEEGFQQASVSVCPKAYPSTSTCLKAHANRTDDQ